MSKRSAGPLLVPFLFGVLSAQDAPADADRNAPLILRLERLADDASATEALAPHLAELLVHADARVRTATLALVLCRPESFGSARAALLAAFEQPRLDDCAAFAYAAALPYFALPMDEAMQLLDTEPLRGARSLGRDIPALLPRLQEVLVRRGMIGEPILVLMRKVHEQAPDAAVAAVAAALVRLDQRGMPLLKLLREWQTGNSVMVEALLTMLGGNDQEIVKDLARIAKEDAAALARIGDVCAVNNTQMACAALQVLEMLGPLAADQWPKVAPWLRTGSMLGAAVRIARNIAADRPDAFAAVIAAVPGADANGLAALARELSRCGPAAAAALPALAARLPHADAQASLQVSETLFVLGGHELLQQSLPALLAHADAEVRARACILAGGFGAGGDAVHERLQQLRGAHEPVVRSAASFALRLLDEIAAIPAVELADLARDRDPWRAVATFQAMRRQSPRTTDLELQLLAGFLQTAASTLDVWAERQVLLDLDSGRLDPEGLARCLAGARMGFSLWWQLLERPDAPQLFLAMIEQPMLLVAVHQVLQSPAAQPHRQRLQELYPALQKAAAAVQNPNLQQVLKSIGLRDTAPTTSQIVEQVMNRPKPTIATIAALIEELAGGDPDQRSRACQQLSNRSGSDWIALLQQVRREGNAAQRRCASALLQGASWTLEQQITHAAAPEPFVAVRALIGMLHGTEARSPAPADGRVVTALLTAMQRPEVLACMAEDGGQSAALLAAIGALGERGLPALRAAMAVPTLRPIALQQLAAAGPAAREFLPDVLRLLRTPARETAGRVLFAMALTPADPEYQIALTAVAALWQESLPHERSGLLPAVAALGAGATFARDGIQDLLRSGYAGSLLNSPQLLQLLPREPLHGWMQLALRGDDAAKQQIALLVLAGSERFVTGSAELTTLWQRAASSHALIAAVRRWAAEARGEEADRMVAMVLDSLDAEKPLPAAGEILALHQQRVAALLPDHVKKRGLKPMLAVALAQSCPLVLFDLLDVGARADQVSVMLAALDGLPRGTDEVAARIDRSLLTCTPQTRQPLLRALIAQGPPALPMLRAHLAPDADLRADLLQALRTAGSQAAYMAPVLGQLLDAGETDPAVLACISRLGGAGLTDAVRRAGTPEQATDLLAAAATDGDPATRTVAMRLLQDRDPARAVAAARSNANHPLAEVRRWAGLVLLADHGDEVDASLLQQLFFDEDALLRRRALETLARARVWPQLLGIAATDLLADRDPGVRRAAAAAFAAHPEECPPSRRALTEVRAAATDPATVADLDRALAHR